MKPFCRYPLHLLSLIPLFLACTEEITLDIPSEEQEIVVNALISDAKPFRLHLSKTISITDETFPVVDNAVIQLKDASTGEVIDSLHYDQDSWYRGSHNFYEYNKPLQLDIQLDGKHLQATSYIANPVSIQSARSIWPSGYDQYGDALTEYQLTFKDPAEKENYYELFYFDYSYSERFNQESSGYRINENLAYVDPIIQAEGLESFDNKSLLFSDRLFDGELITVKVKYYAMSRGINVSTLSDTSHLKQLQMYALFRTVSKEYYDYRRSWTTHRYTQQNKPATLKADPIIDDISHFLFVGDPTKMSSSVTNGLGFFAGYSQNLKEVEKIIDWDAILPQK